MSTLPINDCFLFVIRTDSYAGNFEREMCGYITGQYGDCEECTITKSVGEREAELFEKECPDNYDEFEDLVISFPGEHGCQRPVTIWSNECTAVAIFLETKPTDAQLDLMRERARKFAKMTDPHDGNHTCITISGFELREYLVKHTDTEIAVWKGDE